MNIAKNYEMLHLFSPPKIAILILPLGKAQTFFRYNRVIVKTWENPEFLSSYMAKSKLQNYLFFFIAVMVT